MEWFTAWGERGLITMDIIHYRAVAMKFEAARLSSIGMQAPNHKVHEAHPLEGCGGRVAFR